MSERQDNEFRVFGFIDNRLRRGVMITIFAMQTAAIVWLFVALGRQDERHRLAERDLLAQHRATESELRGLLITCKDQMTAKVEELENRQLLMLKELYQANARLEQQVSQRSGRR